MRCIIAGGRSINNYQHIIDAIKANGFSITTVVSGKASGVDCLGERWANENKKSIALFPAEWDKYGRSAGPIRNEKMAKNADALIAIWDGKSKGTKNMIKQAKSHNLKIYIHRVD